MKIISKIFILISVFLFFYTLYNSEVKWDGTKRDYFFNYYLLGILLILYFSIIHFLNEKIRAYLVIINICVGLSIYISEFLLINLEDQQIYKSYKKNAGKNFDKRSTIEVYKDTQKTDENVSVLIYPDNHLKKNNSNNIFPFSGVANAKTIQCNENGYYSFFNSDRYGFNNFDEVWDKKEIDYLLIGDSMAQGECVNSPHRIGDIIKERTKKNLINLGYGSTGTLIQFATFREYYGIKNYKKLIWLYYEGNDSNDLSKELENDLLKKYLKEDNFSQNLKNEQENIDKIGRTIITQSEKRYNERLKLKYINFVKLKKVRQIFFKATRPRIDIMPIPDEFELILKKTKKITDKDGVEIFFVYLPDYYRYSNFFDEAYYDKEMTLNNYIKIKKIVKKLKINFVDIHLELFSKEIDPQKYYPFRKYKHYTPEGYKRVTKVILKNLGYYE